MLFLYVREVLYMKGNRGVSLQKCVSHCAYEDCAKMNSKDNI